MIATVAGGGERGGGPGHEGAAIGTDRQIHMLQRAKRGKLKNSFRRTAEPTHQRILSTIQY